MEDEMEDEKGSFHFRKKWKVDDAIRLVERAVRNHSGLDRYEVLDGWHSLKAYMATLEIEVRSYHRKEEDGICV